MRFSFLIGSLIIGILGSAQHSHAATCTITTYNADNIKDAGRNCAEIILSDISVPPGETLTVNLNDGAKLGFRGTITWGFYNWDGPLANITGTNIEIYGEEGHVLDTRGNLWWDNLGEAGGTIKPVSLVLHGVYNGLLRNITIKNPPFHAIWIEHSDGVIAQDVYVDSIAGDYLGGNNTDGFNVWTSNNVTIQRITVYNQDDCVAIKSGTNIIVRDNYCSGGHGLSIGSVGGRDYNIVENVTISNSEVTKSQHGVRIKTVYLATGSVTNVTFENIKISNITKYGIIANGDYNNHDHVASGGVPITHFILKNITGTCNPSAANIYVLVKNATDWQWTDINVTGGELQVECDGIPEDSGITCN